MVELAVLPSSLSSFGPYRRRRALAAIVQELQQTPEPATPAGIRFRVDVAALTAALQHLAPAPNPAVVFGQLAELLVPSVCDEADVEIYVGDELARWQQQRSLFTAEVPTSRVDGGGRGWTVTVCTAGRPVDDGNGNGPGEPGYVAAVTCRGHGEYPTIAEVALLKIAVRCAAAAVFEGQQNELLHARDMQIGHLRTALDSNRVIGAAVGVLMATHRLPYQQAFELLIKKSQDTNTKLVAVADTVLYTGTLPPGL